MLARPLFCVRHQRLADAASFMARHHHHIVDVAIGATGEKILGLLQLDEADRSPSAFSATNRKLFAGWSSR